MGACNGIVFQGAVGYHGIKDAGGHPVILLQLPDSAALGI